MSVTATPPSAAEVAEASKRGVRWVQVRQPRGVTVGIGTGLCAFAPGEWVTIPRYAVAQMKIDGMIF